MRVVLLFLGSLLFLSPFYIMLVIALKTPAEIAMTPMWQWPANPTWDNFQQVLSNPAVNFGRLFTNTLVIASIGTLGTIFSSAAVAFAFARLKFVGRDRLFLLVLATMMLPGIVTMIPTYVLFAQVGWVNTLLPLTVPQFFGAAYNIFLLRQFFMGIPRDLDEAATLDGANHWTIFSRIIMPNAWPALATVGIFAFIYSWRDFMGPLLYLNDPDRQTLELGLRMYQTINNDQWHLLMAASVLVSIPLVILFFIGQRAFVQGIALTGGK